MTKEPADLDLSRNRPQHREPVRMSPYERDPVAALTALVPVDPTIAELAAFRAFKPDMAEAAFRARSIGHEAFRMELVTMLKDGVERDARIGLGIMSAAFEATVAIWPCDSTDIADAKLALQPDVDYQAQMRRGGNARHCRVWLTSLSPGHLTAPADPAPPAPGDRALQPWPLRRLDLENDLPETFGKPTYGMALCEELAGLSHARPDLERLADKVEAFFASADMLAAQSKVPGQNQELLHQASQGALIVAYLTAAQVGLWPAKPRSGDRRGKLRVAALVNARATTSDPLHMQAAVQIAFTAGEQLALHNPARFDRTELPAWAENV